MRQANVSGKGAIFQVLEGKWVVAWFSFYKKRGLRKGDRAGKSIIVGIIWWGR